DSRVWNSMPPLKKLFWPALLRQRDEFRTIFKMHAVNVEPFGAPDESVTLEDLADRTWHAITPRKRAGAVLQKLPIIRMLLVDVDRSRESVHRQARCVENGAAIVGARGWQQKLAHRGRQRVELLHHCGEPLVDIVDAGDAHAPAAAPGQPRPPP